MSIYIVDPPELEKKKNIGRYVMLYNSEKFLGKIVSFDKGEGTLVFLQIAGNEKDNGKKFKSRYDRNYCQVKVYSRIEEAMRAFNGKRK